MKTLKLGQKFILGKYKVEVRCNNCNFYLYNFYLDSYTIFTQFGITREELHHIFNLTYGVFPEAKSLKDLTKVLKYILKRAFENTKWKVTEDESKKLQELFFICGYGWVFGKWVLKRDQYLFIKNDNCIYTSYNEFYFNFNKNIERDPKQFLDLYYILIGDNSQDRVNECKELNDKKDLIKKKLRLHKKMLKYVDKKHPYWKPDFTNPLQKKYGISANYYVKQYITLNPFLFQISVPSKIAAEKMLRKFECEIKECLIWHD